MKKSKSSPNSHNKTLIQQPVFLFFTICLVSIVSFVAGTRTQDIQSVFDPLRGISRSSDSLDLSAIQNTYKYLDANYAGTLDKQALIDGASRGLVNAAGDKYTAYLNKTEAEAFRKELSGDVGAGIGAQIRQRNGEPTIVGILDDNPAKQAGLLAGDVIVTVNGESAKGWTAEEAANEIRGDVGTTVKLDVSRSKTIFSYTITRAEINNPSVTSRVQDNIGIIKISRFDEQTGSLARKAAENLKRQNVQAVIVDVRGDGGGYLDAAVDVAGLWLEDKVVVTQKSDQKVLSKEKTGKDAPLKGMETLVLVDGGTASSSEILAASLRDHGAAQLIGEKTFGKGSVQQVIEINGGALLKVTIARWYTPKDKNINGKGLEPDFVVTLADEDYNAGRDPQLSSALERLR